MNKITPPVFALLLLTSSLFSQKTNIDSVWFDRPANKILVKVTDLDTKKTQISFSLQKDLNTISSDPKNIKISDGKNPQQKVIEWNLKNEQVGVFNGSYKPVVKINQQSPFKPNKNFTNSLIWPGAGGRTIRNSNASWVKGLIGWGMIAAGTYLSVNASVNYNNNAKLSATKAEADAVLNTFNTQMTQGVACLGGAAAVWTIDLATIFSKNKKAAAHAINYGAEGLYVVNNHDYQIVNGTGANLDTRSIYVISMEKAEALFARNEYDKAKFYYDAALKDKPGDKEATNRLNTIYLSTTDLFAKAKAENQNAVPKPAFKTPKFAVNIGDITDIRVVEPSKTEHKNAVAVVLGIEKYQNLPPAPYAANDAEIMEEFFKKRFGISNVILLRNEEVSSSNLRKIFNPDYGELQRSVIKGETDVYVFYSGHGVPNKAGDKVYLFPNDGMRDGVEDFGYDINKFYEDLNKIGAHTTTVILDACFSGSARSSEKVLAENISGAKGVKIQAKSNLNYPNFTVISSSTDNETSLGLDATETGLFTYYFCDGLLGKADTDGDKKITLGEMRKYVIQNVKTASVKISGLQTPQFFGDENNVLVEY